MSLALALALTLAAPPFDVPGWNVDRLETQRTGLTVLGGWALANLAVGAAGAATAADEQTRWLHLGNLLWNTVNLGIAAVGLATGWREDPARLDALASRDAGRASVTAYAVNAGLDLAYLATAGVLWHRGVVGGDARLVGLGQALLLQGAFLLVFDVAMALIQGAQLTRLVEGVPLPAQGKAAPR